MQQLPDHSLFTAALGLTRLGGGSVNFDAAAKRMDLEVGFAAGRALLSACGATGQAVRGTRRRSWQHLHFFEHRAYIHARCRGCSARLRQDHAGGGAWARPGSGFTQLFEALAITLCAQMPVQAVARHLGVGDDALWRVLTTTSMPRAARPSEVTVVGMEQTAARRGRGSSASPQPQAPPGTLRLPGRTGTR